METSVDHEIVVIAVTQPNSQLQLTVGRGNGGGLPPPPEFQGHIGQLINAHAASSNTCPAGELLDVFLGWSLGLIIQDVEGV